LNPGGRHAEGVTATKQDLADITEKSLAQFIPKKDRSESRL
jgi:hypothetical protein